MLALGFASELEQQRLLYHLGEQAIALSTDADFEWLSCYMDN